MDRRQVGLLAAGGCLALVAALGAAIWGPLWVALVLGVIALVCLLPVGRWLRYPLYRKRRAELSKLMKHTHGWLTRTELPENPLEHPTVQFMTGRGTHKEPTSGRPLSVEFLQPKGGIAREHELPVRVACGFGYVTITDFHDDGFVVAEDRTAKDTVEVRVRLAKSA
jgi:hypothetical protein